MPSVPVVASPAARRAAAKPPSRAAVADRARRLDSTPPPSLSASRSAGWSPGPATWPSLQGLWHRLNGMRQEGDRMRLGGAAMLAMLVAATTAVAADLPCTLTTD